MELYFQILCPVEDGTDDQVWRFTRNQPVTAHRPVRRHWLQAKTKC